jgi:iron complex transport system permease protein
MRRLGLEIVLALVVLAALVAGTAFGESHLDLAQYLQALSDPHSGPAEVLWTIRAPRAATAAVVGGCLGLAGALMQGVLRNPLADPGVLGVSACAGLGAAVSIVLGMALTPGAVEAAAFIGAALGGGLLILFATRFPEPEALVLFGVALCSFAGAVTALVFNLSPSPIATAEVLNWLLGSVENRSWSDVLVTGVPLLIAAGLSLTTGRALKALTLGDETASTLGLDMRRWKIIAIFAASLATGAAVATAGVVGFVGLAAPHLVRSFVREDPARLLIPSALAGAAMLAVADLATRMTPTDQELKLGVFTALVGAPLFALLAWRSARSWRR